MPRWLQSTWTWWAVALAVVAAVVVWIWLSTPDENTLPDAYKFGVL